MKPSGAKRAPVTKRRVAAGRQPSKGRRVRKLVDDVTAILLISPDAERLCEFYRATLGLPLEVEVHDGMPRHYGCALGDVHLAIHSADSGWPGAPSRRAQSPVIAFSTSDVKAVARRMAAQRVETTGPTDHGFGQVLSFRDPDGNLVSIIEYRADSG
jgi:catechol 2,3-dioxygenase-like lactoylglutathione lyase family enzyme